MRHARAIGQASRSPEGGKPPSGPLLQGLGILALVLLLPVFRAAGEDEGGDHIAQWHVLYDEAVAHEEAGRLAEGQEGYAEAARAARDAGLPPSYVAEALLGRIRCLGPWDAYLSIRDVSRQLLEVQHEILDRALKAADAADVREARTSLSWTHMDLGYVQTRLGELSEGAAHLHTALELAEAAESEQDVGDVLARLANLEQVRGRLGPALVAAELAEVRHRAGQDPVALVETLLVISRIRVGLGRLDDARAALDEAKAILERLDAPLPGHRADVLRGEAALCVNTGDYEGAVKASQGALDLLLQARHAHAAAKQRIALAQAEILRGRPKTALAHLDDVVLAYAPGNTLRFRALTQRARALTQLGRRSEAIRFLEGVLAESALTEAPRYRFLAQERLALAYLAQGEPIPACRALADALDAADEMSAHLTTLAERQARDRRAPLFALAERIGLAHPDLERGYAIIEQARASSLLRNFGGSRALLEHAAPAIRAPVLAARDDLIRAQSRLAQADARGHLATIRDAAGALTLAQRAYRDTIERARRSALRPIHGAGGAEVGDRAHRRAQLPPARISQLAALQATLGSDEAFVLYASGSSELGALVVTSTGVEQRRLGDAETIERASQSLRREFLDATRAAQKGRLSRAAPASSDAVQQLRRLLIARLRLPAEAKRLLVSPATGMATLPFALLTADDQEVTLVPSGTVYMMLASQAAVRGEGVLALGDPSYTSERVIDANPKHLALRTPLGSADLDALPRTRQEVDSITGPDDVRLLGPMASEDRLLEQLQQRPRWRAVHFACHGMCDPRQPEWSSLALAPSDTSDGYLSVLEILGLQVHADAVVLSACETGLGEELWGSGLLSLATAFLNAGSPRVLASLWQVDSAATSELVETFYEHWNPPGARSGLRASKALRLAQEHVRTTQNGRWAHPYYWAGWVLWGRSD